MYYEHPEDISQEEPETTPGTNGRQVTNSTQPVSVSKPLLCIQGNYSHSVPFDMKQ